MRFGNATIQAPPGSEVVRVNLRMKPIGVKPCCEAKNFLLLTAQGDTAESVWGQMQGEAPMTLELPFIAPTGSVFKTLHVNGVVIDVTAIPSKPVAPAPSPKAATAPANTAVEQFKRFGAPVGLRNRWLVTARPQNVDQWRTRYPNMLEETKENVVGFTITFDLPEADVLTLFVNYIDPGKSDLRVMCATTPIGPLTAQHAVQTHHQRLENWAVWLCRMGAGPLLLPGVSH